MGLKSSRWQVLNFESNHLSKTEIDRQRDRNMSASLVVRDREYPFSEDLIVTSLAL